MILIETTTKEKYTITDILRNGENHMVCPACVGDRKNKSKKPFMFNASKGTGKCYHCSSIFVVENNNSDNMQKIERVYQKPIWRNKTELSDAMVKYWEGRGISQVTLREMKISEGKEWMPQAEKEMNTVQFNYFRDGELINIKYRTGDKKFKLFKDAELILYNLDAIKDSTECLICEGEPDCLSWIEAGYKFAVSVPNGASKSTQNLQYIDNCYEYFENKTKIYISNDNDPAGMALRDELVRRLGEDRCFLVDLEGMKDSNEYLTTYHGEQLLNRLKCAKEIPIEGVFSVENFEPDLDVLYHYGLQSGLKIGHDDLDNLITWETKRMLIVTAIPGHGKSEFVDEITTRLNLLHGWKTAYFSPENFPLTYHASKMIEKVIGKKMSKLTMPMSEYVDAKVYVNDNFRFIMPKEDDFTLDNILERARLLVRQIGIRVLVIDPWNRLEYQQERGETETKYIARQLIKMANFAKKNDVLLVLVAHPVKMGKTIDGKYEVPTMYSISGSANFFNIADYGIALYREDQKVTVYVQKVKFKHLGGTGSTEFKYNFNNGRYVSYDGINDVAWDNTNYLLNKPFLFQENNEIDDYSTTANTGQLTPNSSFYEQDDKPVPF